MSSFQARAAEQSRKLSYEEFLDWCDEDTLAEWVNGDIVMISPASSSHQAIADFLLIVLKVYVEQRELGRVISAPFQMKTNPALSGREPDLLFIAWENLGRLKNTYLDGPAVATDGRYERQRADAHGVYRSQVVAGFWLKEEWLWQESLPKVLSVLHELGVV